MSTSDYKQAASDFLMLASKGKGREAFSKNAGKNFKHHNIYFIAEPCDQDQAVPLKTVNENGMF